MGDRTKTIHGLFDAAAGRHASAAAVHVQSPGRSPQAAGAYEVISYAALRDRALRVAAWLQRKGISKGAAGAIVLENSPDWIAIYLGMSFAGVTCVPLDIQADPRDISACIRDSGSRIVFTSAELRERTGVEIRDGNDAAALPAAARLVIVAGAEYEEIIAGGTGGGFVPPDVGPDDVASLIYTSGTTDRPKGVMLSQANVCANFSSMSTLGICRADDNIFALLPLHHTYPFMVTMILPLLTGASLTFAPRGFKPQEISAVIKAAGVTIVVGVPQLFTLLHAAIAARLRSIPPAVFALAGPLIRRKVRGNFGPTVRLCASGGARLDPSVARELTRWGLPVIEGYGLTEATPVVTFNPPGRVKYGTVGPAIPGVELRIHDPGPSGEGEILIRGGNVMKGYYRNDELTRETIRDGWLHSGDLGMLDKDGYLTITGRLKEVIVLASGKNIYPEELDAHYSQSPYIKEMCVIGVPRAGGGAGETLFAVIRPDFERFRADGEGNITAKIRWELENLAKPLPAYKHIMGFALVKEELPRTTLRKVKRYEVRKRYLQAQTAGEAAGSAMTPEDRALMDSPTGRKVIEYISRRLKKNVAPDNHLELDLGIDSLTRVEVALGLEEELGLSIPDEALYAVSTIRDVIATVEELLSAGRPVPPERGSVSDWRTRLFVPPPAPLASAIAAKPGIGGRSSTFFARLLCVLLVRLPWFVRARRDAPLDQAGGVIFCPNHASYLDGLFIFSTLPYSRAINTYFLGNARIFSHPLLRWMVRPGRIIPIDPSADMVSALQATAFALAQGKSVCVFPEGQRSINEEVGEFKKGIGILVKELDIPVVPVYIKGSHRSWPRTKKFPRLCAVQVRYGRSMGSAELLPSGTPGNGAYEAIARRLREEVIKLSSE